METLIAICELVLPPSINRTIVEWKQYISDISPEASLSINRTIVEWKLLKGLLSCLNPDGINRTIVEWKRSRHSEIGSSPYGY